MKYKAALFDMDGIIVNSELIHMAAFKAVLKDHGYGLDDSGYAEYFAGKTDAAGFASYFASKGKAIDLRTILEEKATKYFELAVDQLVPYPGIVPLIEELSKHIPLALVTGSLRREAELVLRTFGITDCFEAIVAAEDISQSKPDPEGYELAAAKMRLLPRECVVIEDSPSGVKAAIAAGADCIAITNTHSPRELREASRILSSIRIEHFE